MAGPNAVIRVDSFEGGQLPPKSQIKSIHITRDAFAAENHFAGALFIDIITQPGIGALRAAESTSGCATASLSARNPFATRKGPERQQNYGMNLGGSLIKEKSSFSFSVQRLHVVRHAVPSPTFPASAVLRAAADSPAERQRVRVRPLRLRADARSDAAGQREPQSVHAATIRESAATTPSSAPTRRKTRAPTSASRKPGRSAAGSSPTRA